MEYHQVPEGTTPKRVNYANHFYLKLFKTTLFSNKIFHPPIEQFLKTSKTPNPQAPCNPLVNNQMKFLLAVHILGRLHRLKFKGLYRKRKKRS